MKDGDRVRVLPSEDYVFHNAVRSFVGRTGTVDAEVPEVNPSVRIDSVMVVFPGDPRPVMFARSCLEVVDDS